VTPTQKIKISFYNGLLGIALKRLDMPNQDIASELRENLKTAI